MLDFGKSYLKKRQYTGTTFQVLNTVQMAIDFPKCLSIFCSRRDFYLRLTLLMLSDTSGI